MITKSIKKDFPILSRKVGKKQLVYLDNSATTQSPKVVIDSLTDFYTNHRANVHRGIHMLSEESTVMYEQSRKTIAHFFGVTPSEMVFVRNTTEASNLVAFTFLQTLKKGSTVMISEFEHHSNLIPWQIACKQLKLNFKTAAVNSEGELDLNFIKNSDFSFIAINHISNFLGNINPVHKIIEIAKEKKAYVYIDGAQAVARVPLNFKKLDCDFYSFSGHKIYGPFGIGGLYVKKQILESMPPFMTGGGMIVDVGIKKSSFLKDSEGYDAGTPNVGGSIALASALDYVTQVGIKEIAKHEHAVLTYMYESLLKVSGVEIYGTKKVSNRAGLVSFNLKGVHSHDLASILDGEGIAIRSGTHCVIPMHKKLNISSSARASLALYNFKEDVDVLIEGVKKSKKILGGYNV